MAGGEVDQERLTRPRVFQLDENDAAGQARSIVYLHQAFAVAQSRFNASAAASFATSRPFVRV